MDSYVGRKEKQHSVKTILVWRTEHKMSRTQWLRMAGASSFLLELHKMVTSLQFVTSQCTIWSKERGCSYEDDFEGIGTAGAVCCNDCVYPRKSACQPFLLCDCSVASGDRRLLHLLHRKGAVDFPGYPCRYGINGNPNNLSVGMGGCKT